MTEPVRTKRQLKNLKLTEKYRFKYLGLWLLLSFALIGLLDVAVYLLYDQLWHANLTQGPDPLAEISYQRSMAMTSIAGFNALFFTAIVFLSVWTAHRIGGPFLAMKRTMADIRDGQLDRRLKFRKYDKLNDVEVAFNEMMDALEQKVEGTEPPLDLEAERLVG